MRDSLEQHPSPTVVTFRGYRSKRVGRGSISGIVEGGVVGLAYSRRCSSDRINLIGRMTPAVMAGFAA